MQPVDAYKLVTRLVGPRPIALVSSLSEDEVNTIRKIIEEQEKIEGDLRSEISSNIKRLMAYSTIAHAGYMMMAIPPMLAMAQSSPDLAEKAVAALAIYIAVYLFMNLGAFSVVAFLRNEIRSEEIADYGGLIRRSPFVVICFAIILFALVGLPPLSGCASFAWDFCRHPR